ncbi:MAG: copper resistance protein B [Alphaproteobacteria bacterium]|nr:copper resistance protein B [Alphaproteobacteria bacterium]
MESANGKKPSGKMKTTSGKMKMTSGKMKSMGNSSMQGGSAPAGARDPNAYADGYEYLHIGGFEETDMMTVSKILAEEFEYSANKGNNALIWDTQGWRGTDYNKLWVKFQGQKDISVNSGEMELQALYSRTVAAFWDFQVGARYDTAFGTGAPGDRVFAVIGFQGLAPYWFEVEPAIFVSNKGDISARLTASYDLLFTQRLILQPRIEANFAASRVRDYNIGKGLNDIQLDLRLRYEIRRKFAPYIGVTWNRKFGETADMVLANGDNVSNFSFVSGIRFWF